MTPRLFGSSEYWSEAPSNYIFPKRRYRSKSPIAGHSFQASKLKLGMNDHLMGADVLGYPDIRISAFEIFGFFRIFCYCGLHFRPRKLKLGVNAHLMGADVLGYPDIRISASGFFGYLALTKPF